MEQVVVPLRDLSNRCGMSDEDPIPPALQANVPRHRIRRPPYRGSRCFEILNWKQETDSANYPLMRKLDLRPMLG